MMVMEQLWLRAHRASIDSKLEASTLLLFWGSQMAHAQAEIEAAEQRRDISTRNYNTVLERLGPYPLPARGEPSSKSEGKGEGEVCTTDKHDAVDIHMEEEGGDSGNDCDDIP
jgi:hypothetical protein